MDLSNKTKPVRTSIDLSDAVPTTIVNPLVVDDRTAKYSFALGQDTPPELRQIVQSGDESNLRANVSAKDVLHRQEQALALFPGTMQGVTGTEVGDREYALAAASVEPIDPSVVIEDKYSEKAVNTIQSMSKNEGQQAEEAQLPVEAETAYRIAQDHIAKKEIAMKLAQDQSTKVGVMGWGSYLFYTAGQMAPFLQWANYASYDSKYHWETQGGARLSKIKQLYSLSPYQFYIEANKEIDRLAVTNPLDAAQFAQDLTIYGAQSAAVDTAFGLVDVPFVGAGKMLVKAPKTVARMKEVAKAVSQPVTTIPDVLANVGHIEDAAEASAREVVAKASLPKEAGKDEVIEMSNLIRQTPSQWNPKLFVNETGKYPILATERLVTVHNDIINKLAKATSGVLRAATLPQEALNTAMDLALEGYKKTYTKYADNILNVTRILPDETGTGTAKLQIDWGTDQGKNTFITESGALQAKFKRYRLKDAEIVKLGEESWVLRQTIDVAENDPAVFAKLLSPDNVSGRTTWAQFKQYAAGAKEVVSDFQAQQRAAVSHGTTYMGELIADVLRPAFKKLSKKQFDDLDKIMVTNRDGLRNPEDPTTRGMFYENVSQLAQAYMTHIKRYPSEEEVQAYFAVRTLSDFDWKMRSLQSYKAKARWGAQNHEIRVFNKETKKDFPTVIEAKRIDQLPGNSKNDANVLVIVDTPDKMEQGVFQLSELVSETHKAKMAELTDPAKGKYTVLHVYDAQNRSLNEATGFHQPIHYVVTKESRPTGLKLENQVPYAPGFHVEYKENWFLKAAQFAWNKGRRAFTGDVTLLGIRTEKEGKQLLAALEEARKLRKAKSAQYRSYLEKNTPFTLQEFENMLKATGEDAPFTLARNGKTSADGSSVTHDGRNLGQVYGEFDNLVNSPHNPAIAANMEFLGEKDPMLKRAINEGTEMDPVWKLGNAEMYNPMETQTRAMGRLIRSSGYEDYQFGAINSFIEEWGVRRGALKFGGETVTQDMLYRNPMYYFRNSEVVHPDKNIQAAARANKQAIEDLMGYPSETAMSIDDFRLKLQEGILGGRHVPDKIMPFLKDPFTYARAAVSHMKLGLFNPVQLFLQQATHANIILISPKAGLKQIPATMMMRLLSLTEDPKIIEHFAERNAGFGWNKKMFLESLEGYKRSGFGKIGGEYAWRNDVADPKFFKGLYGKFLDKGYLFFNHAEQNVRLAAWNTAYLEHLEKTGKSAGSLKDVDLRKILARAQDLSGNMTRDASAFWQRGALGSVTQFYAYTARITELLIGKRLSRAEKLRLGGGLGVLYGVPALGGIGYLMETGDVSGAIAAMNPFDEDLRTYALENGIAIDDTAWGVINNGLASSLLYLATGEHFDVASRYSPFTLDITSNIVRNFDQHNPALAILLSAMGASGSVARDVFSSAYPIAEDMYQMLGEGGSTQLLMDDIMNASREISSANVLYKINQAINGQLYLSKKGTLISDQSKENATLKVMEALTGLSTYDETDTFRLIWSDKESAQIKKDTLKTLQKYGNYYMQALRNGQDTRPYMMRIEATLALIEDPVERSNVFRGIFSQRELQEGVWNAFTKNGSLEQRNKRKELQLQKQKEQQ